MARSRKGAQGVQQASEPLKQFWSALPVSKRLQILTFEDAPLVKRATEIHQELMRSELNCYLFGIRRYNEAGDAHLQVGVNIYDFGSSGDMNTLHATAELVENDAFVDQLEHDLKDLMSSKRGKKVQRKHWASVFEASPSSWTAFHGQLLRLTALALTQAYDEKEGTDPPTSTHVEDIDMEDALTWLSDASRENISAKNAESADHQRRKRKAGKKQRRSAAIAVKTSWQEPCFPEETLCDSADEKEEVEDANPPSIEDTLIVPEDDNSAAWMVVGKKKTRVVESTLRGEISDAHAPLDSNAAAIVSTSHVGDSEPRSTLVYCTSSSTVATLGDDTGACSESVEFELREASEGSDIAARFEDLDDKNCASMPSPGIDAKDEGNNTMHQSQELALQLVFEQEARKVPSLRRAWRTPDPSPTRHGDEDLPRCCAPTLRIVRRGSASEDSDSVERGRSLSRQSDLPMSTPSARTPSPCPHDAHFPYAHEYPPPPAPGSWLSTDQCMGTISPESQAMAAPPFFCIPYWPCGPCVVDVSAPSCGDASVSFAEETKEVSVGSRGHPTECADPCKYFSKGRGCKDGAACNRCHICPWKRSAREAPVGQIRDSRSRGRAVERR